MLKIYLRRIILFFIILYLIFAASAASFAQKNTDRVLINFRGEDILAVLEFYSDLLQKTFIPGESVQGQITVISPRPVTVNQAKQLLFSILDMKQLAVVEYPSYFKVISKQKATQSPLQVSSSSSTEGEDMMMTGIIHLKYANAEDIAQDLARLISEEGAVFAAKKLNYLIVTSTIANFTKIKKIVTQIDKPNSIPEARSYKIQYMNAEKFAETLTKVAEANSAQEKSWGYVVPVQETNSIVVTATEAQHKELELLIKQLDVSKKQVSISAMFVEVSLNDNFKMGVEWLIQDMTRGTTSNVANDLGSLFTTVTGNPVQKITGTGLKVSILKSGEFNVLANFLSSNDDTKIISTPHILAMENQEAKLRVGNQVPVKKGTRYDSQNREISTFEQLDLGLELLVTPIISQNREVTMNIKQKLSNLIAYDEDNGSYQSSEREAATTVVVNDQDTLVIGGLISHTGTFSQKGIPGLKNIPLLGNLFGSTEDDNTARELLIFITPTVIANKQEGMLLNEQEKRKHSLLVDQIGMEFDL